MRDVVITGVGLVSSLGEGLDVHLEALRTGHRVVDTDRFAPFVVHPMPAIEWDRQIPKKSDQRQMEAWQLLGCHVAGLALEHAGVKGEADLKSRMHLIVAAAGGERDLAVDAAILDGLRAAPDHDAFLNERLMNDLRPTLFLAQLSNLLAGNISIVHGVTGASRTFMGEEQSGVDALRIAHARIAAGQTEAILVGGATHGDRPDLLALFGLGNAVLAGPWTPTFARTPGRDGFAIASGGAFVLLESRDHAVVRGARALARLATVVADQPPRAAGSVIRTLQDLWAKARVPSGSLVVSGASGLSGPTAEEAQALARLSPDRQPLALQDVIGHLIEPQPVAGLALATGLVSTGQTRDAVVTSVGHKRGEAVIVVSEA